MALVSALTEKLGIDIPILLAPMAGVSGGELAAAVSRAGGLGFIGTGYMEEDWLRGELAKAGNEKIGAGFITWVLAQKPHLLPLALDHAPKAIFLSFGEIEPFAPQVKERGIPLIAQVQTLAQAKRAAKAGADFIVAQGTEAGGHGAKRATFPLVPAIADAVDVPVIAAGGIGDGRGLAAALMLGACGAVCGSAFYAAPEALSHAKAKEQALGASGDDTQRSSVFDIARGIDWPREWTMRTLKNSFSEKWTGDTQALQQHAAEEGARYAEAAAKGDFNTAAIIIGEAVDLVTQSRPAEEITRKIASDAETLLKNAAANFLR